MILQWILKLFLLCGFTHILPAGPQAAPGHAEISYRPPSEIITTLGRITTLIQSGETIDGSEFKAHPASHICKLPGGQIYFEVATMNVDDDGNRDGSPKDWTPRPFRNGKIDFSHQDHTSYGSQFPNPVSKDHISAFTQPYLVLPGVHSSWYRKHGIQMGDGAVIIKGKQKIITVIADVGPDAELGEMSVKAHQLFGFETFERGKTTIFDTVNRPETESNGRLLSRSATVTVNHAQRGPFVVIVFPGTSTGLKFVSVRQTLEPKVNQLFQTLAEGTQ